MPSIKDLRRGIAIRFNRRRKRRTIEAQTVKQDCLVTSHVTFPLLDLSDDVISHILSFVSSAPFEFFEDDAPLFQDFISPTVNKNRKPTHFSPFQPTSHYQAALIRKMEVARLTHCAFGTLTHVLPLVCWRFHRICRQSDGRWSEALQRLSISSPEVWRLGVSKLIEESEERSLLANSKPVAEEMDGKLSVPVACQGMFIFQRVVDRYRPYLYSIRAPIITYPSSLPPTEMESRWFHFGPGRRSVIDQLMLNRSFRDRAGHMIASPRPRLLVSFGVSSSAIMVGDPALVVELRRCVFKPDGDILVMMAPVRNARIKILSNPVVGNEHFRHATGTAMHIFEDA